LQYLRQTTDVRAVVILVGTMTIFGWSYSVLMPVFADEILGRGARGLGFLVSCNGLGALTAGLTLAVLGDTMRPSRLAFAGIGIFCVSVSALALSRVYWFSAACMVLVGFGLVIFLATSNATLQRRVSDGMRGRIMGIYSFVFNGFFPLGSLVAGFLAHRWNAPFAVLFGAGVCALTALLLARQVSPRSATMDSLKSD
jgi:MFS family permease